MLASLENWRIKGELNLTVPAESRPLRKAGSSASLSRLEYPLFQTFQTPVMEDINHRG